MVLQNAKEIHRGRPDHIFGISHLKSPIPLFAKLYVVPKCLSSFPFSHHINHTTSFLPCILVTTIFSVNVLNLQQSSIRSTVMLRSTERFRGSKGRIREQMRKDSEMKVQTGLHLHQICLHPALSALLEGPRLHCGRTYLMCGPAVS